MMGDWALKEPPTFRYSMTDNESPKTTDPREDMSDPTLRFWPMERFPLTHSDSPSERCWESIPA